MPFNNITKLIEITLKENDPLKIDINKINWDNYINTKEDKDLLRRYYLSNLKPILEEHSHNSEAKDAFMNVFEDF